MKRPVIIILIWITLFPLSLFSQQEHVALSIIKPKTIRPTYLQISFGSSYLNFRDFATSPVFYHGFSGDFAFSRLVESENRESRQGFLIGYGLTSTLNTLSNSNASFGYLDIIHTELYKIPLNLPDYLNLKAGGHLKLTGNNRQNASLRNNSLGMEAVGTLFASAKLGVDVSRKKRKQYDLKLFNFNLLPRKRVLSFQLNIAVLNATYRNGYVYMEHGSILDDYDYFENHKIRLFNGYRLSSALEYKISLKNGNAFKFSYWWDAYHSGNKTDKLEVARHHLMLSFMFSLNETIENPEEK